jgi:hypothetical protein
MVDGWGFGQSYFPDDLRPHVKRGIGVLPPGLDKRRPEFVTHPRHDTLKKLSVFSYQFSDGIV